MAVGIWAVPCCQDQFTSFIENRSGGLVLTQEAVTKLTIPTIQLWIGGGTSPNTQKETRIGTPPGVLNAR
jgi:hypothetical protein